MSTAFGGFLDLSLNLTARTSHLLIWHKLVLSRNNRLHDKELRGLQHFQGPKLDEALSSVLSSQRRPIIFCEPASIPVFDLGQMQHCGFHWKEFTCKWTAEDISKLKKAILDIDSGTADCHTPDSVEYWISHYVFDSKPGYSKVAVRKYINKIMQSKIS